MIQLNRGIPSAQTPLARSRRSAGLATKSSEASFSQQLAPASLRTAPGPEIRAAASQDLAIRQNFGGVNSADRAPRVDTAAISSSPRIPVAAKSLAPQNETDAYWAQQPKEVQALKDIQGLEQRTAKAKELTQQGYAVDYEIQVLGYDPYMTMKGRQEMGYTWVPAMGQASVPLGPGLSYPGLASYDARNPPPGSIPVSIAFAKGLEHTTPTYNVTVVAAG